MTHVSIVVPRWNNHTDSLFYDGYNEIAFIQTKKNRYSLITCGEIRIGIGENEVIDNCNRWEKIEKYRLNDKKLAKLEKEGKLVWKNNNWFEVLWTENKDGSRTAQFDIGNVAYDYDSAIELLKSYAEREQDETRTKTNKSNKKVKGKQKAVSTTKRKRSDTK